MPGSLDFTRRHGREAVRPKHSIASRATPPGRNRTGLSPRREQSSIRRRPRPGRNRAPRRSSRRGPRGRGRRWPGLRPGSVGGRRGDRNASLLQQAARHRMRRHTQGDRIEAGAGEIADAVGATGRTSVRAPARTPRRAQTRAARRPRDAPSACRGRARSGIEGRPALAAKLATPGRGASALSP